MTCLFLFTGGRLFICFNFKSFTICSSKFLFSTKFHSGVPFIIFEKFSFSCCVPECECGLLNVSGQSDMPSWSNKISLYCRNIVFYVVCVAPNQNYVNEYKYFWHVYCFSDKIRPKQKIRQSFPYFMSHKPE